jgi:hypothetical protein
MDSALVQTLAVVLIVAGAAVFLGRRALRSLAAARRARASGSACAGGACGCGEAGTSTGDADSFTESVPRLTSRR